MTCDILTKFSCFDFQFRSKRVQRILYKSEIERSRLAATALLKKRKVLFITTSFLNRAHNGESK